MKKLPFIILLLLTKFTFAQKDTVGLHIPYSEGSVVYERVFAANGKSKDQLYSNAKLWFINHYNNSREILSQDSTVGRVVGKGKETIQFKGPLSVIVPFDDRMTIQIDVKDNRYRCRMYNMTLSTQETDKKDRTVATPEELVNTLTGKGNTSALNKSQARRMLESLNTTIDAAMASLNKTMNDDDDF